MYRQFWRKTKPTTRITIQAIPSFSTLKRSPLRAQITGNKVDIWLSRGGIADRATFALYFTTGFFLLWSWSGHAIRRGGRGSVDCWVHVECTGKQKTDSVTPLRHFTLPWYLATFPRNTGRAAVLRAKLCVDARVTEKKMFLVYCSELDG